MDYLRAVLVCVTMAFVGCATGQGGFVIKGRLMGLPGETVILSAVIDTVDEPEALYCPKVVWEWPDGTESAVESDCPPYAAREVYPRRWTKRVRLGTPGTVPVRVRLERAGHVIARAEVLLLVMGGEE